MVYKMQMKKFMDIERLKPAFLPGFEIGDHIIIQEKIDGANFSIRYDAEHDVVAHFRGSVNLILEITCVEHGSGRKNLIKNL